LVASSETSDLTEIIENSKDIVDLIVSAGYEAGTFAGRLGREEGLKQLVANRNGDAGTVVPYPDLDRVVYAAGRKGWSKLMGSRRCRHLKSLANGF